MEFNEAGLNLIRSFESCRLTAYKDQKGILTIGFGCTHHVSDGMVITQEEANDRLKEDIEETADSVRNMVIPSQINDNQFSACVCLAFNIGVGNFKESTLLHCIKMGNLKDAANEFQRWNKITVSGVKEVFDGLTRRREAEKELFLS